MKRRNFFRNTGLTVFGTTFLGGLDNVIAAPVKKGKTAKNIIFLVSDGMSTGTLTMANRLLNRKEGRDSNWIKLYQNQEIKRAFMDTASASSMITDSAAASSSWGGGVRVPNGSLNTNADGSSNTPILQKFKAAGKAVGCVTTVPITHATPAGFSVISKSRSSQEAIAEQYKNLRFDVMMGGGDEFFSPNKRKDKRDLYQEFTQAGFDVVQTRKALIQNNGAGSKPLLGVFYENGLPFTLDASSDTNLQAQVPTLSELTQVAINKMKNNAKGFVLQVEGGKVDWAAHSNDIGALLYDQIAFDDAVQVALDFAAKDKQTLVVITTDHGNANPGLFYGAKADKNFDRVQTFKHTNEWILKGINLSTSSNQIKERIEYAQGYAIKNAEAIHLLNFYSQLDEASLQDPYKLPFKELAQIQYNYLPVGWGSMDHSSDFVELVMTGPGSELLQPFVKNFQLHNLMLEATGIKPVE